MKAFRAKGSFRAGKRDQQFNVDLVESNFKNEFEVDENTWK